MCGTEDSRVKVRDNSVGVSAWPATVLAMHVCAIVGRTEWAQVLKVKEGVCYER